MDWRVEKDIKGREQQNTGYTRGKGNNGKGGLNGVYVGSLDRVGGEGRNNQHKGCLKTKHGKLFYKLHI